MMNTSTLEAEGIVHNSPFLLDYKGLPRKDWIHKCMTHASFPSSSSRGKIGKGVGNSVFSSCEIKAAVDEEFLVMG